MPSATDATGKLQPITQCTVNVPGAGTLTPRILPEISDSKSATYNDEPIIGRSFPVKTFSHSDNRTISMKWHIVIVDQATLTEAITQLKAFQSCVYPANGTVGQTPYEPPSICTINCGIMTYAGSGSNNLCVVLKSYSVSYPTDVAYDPTNFLPYKFDIDLVWDVVYATSGLPGNSMIIQ
jgi:hypothetical protein